MARTYKRDSRGRFGGGGGGSSRGGGRKPLQRGTNRLTRDNAGRITSQGGDGATARGGRLRTASGKQRATVTAKGIGKAPAGTVGRSGRVKAPARVKARTASNRRRRPTPEQSRAAGLTPIADIRARQAAQAASTDAGRIRRMQSNTTRARGQQVVAAQGRQRAPFGRYSTIKNPAAEGSFPQMAPGRTGQGMAQAAKGRSSHSRPSNTKAINRLNTLRRRVQYLRKDQQDFKFDKFGDRYAGPKLAKARRDLTSEICDSRDSEIVSGLHTIAARFDKTVLADGFKGFLQCVPSFSAHLRRLAAGTKVYATHRAHISSAEVQLPPVSEQRAIAGVLMDMNKEIAALQERLNKAHLTKEGMMQELLTGRIRLA